MLEVAKLNQKMQTTLEYVESLLEQAKDAEQKNTEESLKLCHEALELAKKHQLMKQEGRSYLRMGRCHWINGNFNEAMSYLNYAFEISSKANDLHTKCEVLIGLGNVNVTSELPDQAIIHYQNALDLAMTQGFDELESKIYNNIGTLHEDLKNYPTALKYYQKSLDKTTEIQDGYGSAIANLNIGNVYLSLNNIEESEVFISDSIVYGEKHNKTLLLAHCYHSMIKLYQSRNQEQKSLEYAPIAIEKANISKDMYILFRIYNRIAIIYDSIKDYKNAEIYFKKSLEISNQIGMDELVPRIHEQMGLFYQKNNQHDIAYDHFVSYYQASKKVEENRRVERINSIEVQSKLSASQKETKIYRQLSNDLKRSYQQMHILSNIGKSMTSTHKLGDIFGKLYESVNMLMNAQCLAVGLLDGKTDALKFDYSIEDGELLKSFSLSLKNKKSWNVWSFLNKQVLKINDIEKEYKKYIKGLSATRGILMHSAMYAPLEVEGEVIGVFSIQAKEKNAYTEMDKDLLQTLASYLAIAIKNATKTNQLADLNEKLKMLSELDGLTGIPNRRLYDDKYEQMWEEAVKQNEDLTVMMVDIDDFKSFNDNYSHLVGDEVIKRVASQLTQIKRAENDFVARYGGDEFIVVLPKCSVDEGKQLAEKIHQNLSCITESLTNVKESITVSIGIASTRPNVSMDKNCLIGLADNQLYKSKQIGKNKISYIQN